MVCEVRQAGAKSPVAAAAVIMRGSATSEKLSHILHFLDELEAKASSFCSGACTPARGREAEG